MKSCNLEIDPYGVASFTLNRPEVGNALDESLITEANACLEELDQDPRVRVVQFTANGENFCAGADIRWLRACTAQGSAAVCNMGDLLADFMRRVHDLSKPTIALAKGAAYGGGAGLLACCDIVLAASHARFCFSEVRFGLIPATISPYVIRAIGERAARRYFLSARKFSAKEAYRIGLVHELMPESELSQAANQIAHSVILGGPEALKRTKELVDMVACRALDPALTRDTSGWIAELVESPEGREGIEAFLEKRKPAWVREDQARAD